MKSQALVLLLVVTSLYGYVYSDGAGKSYGGQPIDITKVPWMAWVYAVSSVGADGKANGEECSGSILRKNLILTAAHCFVNDTAGTVTNASKIYINVGSNTNGFTEGSYHLGKNLYVHPKYKGGGDAHYFHDVSIVEIQDEIQLNNKSQLVTLADPDDDPAVGTDVTITGYGTKPDHPDDNRLYQVHLNVISTEQCIEELAGGTAEQVRQHQICSEHKGRNQCPGDSGGPLHDVSTMRQVGIVSWGTKDCTLDKPSIQTRVTNNLDFINKIITETSSDTNSQSASKPGPMGIGGMWDMIKPFMPTGQRTRT